MLLALLLPAVTILLIYLVAFAIFALVGFFPSPDGTIGASKDLSLVNYYAFLGDRAALQILLETIIFAFQITAASILVGYPLGYLMARAKSVRVRSFLLGLLVLTFLTSSISRAYGWMLILGRNGLVNDFLLWSGLISQPLTLIYTNTGVFIALLHFTLPFFVLTVFGSIRGVPVRVEEAARDLGASAIATFFKITVPITLPAIIAGAAIVFSLSLSAFVFPLLLGGGRVRLISNYVYDQIFVTFDMGLAAASASIFLLVALVMLYLFRLVERIAVSSRRGGVSA